MKKTSKTPKEIRYEIRYYWRVKKREYRAKKKQEKQQNEVASMCV
jgi:hypothetical protein